MKKDVRFLCAAIAVLSACVCPGVELGDGPAFGGRPLTLDASASGQVYAAKPGCRPVVTAGRRVTGWKIGADGTWRAQVRSFGRFSQLFVNGQLRLRPFLPRKGYWQVAGQVPCAKGESQKFVVGEGQVDGNWKDLASIEVCMFQWWTMDRSRIAGYDPSTRTVTLDLQGGNENRPYSTNQWFRLDNVRAAFGEPGDCYLEPSGELLYRPLPGETPETVEAIAAVAPQALAMDGVRDVTFRGITFAHAGYSVPTNGCCSGQAAVGAPSAVRLTRCRNVRFEDCAFLAVGGYGLEFGPGCDGCAVTGSVFSGLGAGGVRIGGTDRRDPSQWATRCVVEDCLVEQGGRFDPAGVGVLVLNGNNCRVARNSIRDFYYSGVSCGWTWDRKPNGAFANVIEANDIANVGQGVLTDLGGVYLLGEQRGTVVRRNVIRDVHGHSFNGIGLYLDQGCAFITVEDNYVDGCTDGGFFVQYNTASNLVARNVLCRGGAAQLWHAGAFPERTFPTAFRDNTIWWDDPSKPLARLFFHPRFVASTNNVAGCTGLAALTDPAPGVTLREMSRPEPPSEGCGCTRLPPLAWGLPIGKAVFPPAPKPAAQTWANRFGHVFAWGQVTDEKSARAFADIGVTATRASGTNGYAAARKFGLSLYCSFVPSGGPSQVLRPDEQAYFDKINAVEVRNGLSRAAYRKEVDDRLKASRCQFGGEPVTALDVCPYKFPCFLSDEGGARSKAQMDKILAANPYAEGIVFDGIGFVNLRSCECDGCKARLAADLRKNGLEENDGTRNRFFRAALVGYINMMADHARKARPGIKVAMHLWPAFAPDPLYGKDIRADYIHETVAWYFPWPEEKIADYTRRILTAPHQPGAASVPFVGLKASRKGALAHKSPERLEEELKLILENGGRCLSVCNGNDMLEPGYRDVFRKYARPSVGGVRADVCKNGRRALTALAVAAERVFATGENVVRLDGVKK